MAICDHLVPAGSRETRHALSFPLDHSVFLEARVVSFRVKDGQIANLFGVGLVAVDDRPNRVLGGERLAPEFSSCFPTLSHALVVFRETSYFLLLFQVSQVRHHLHKHFDRLELGSLLCGGREGLVNSFVGDGVEELRVRSLERERGNPIVVDDGIHFGPVRWMKGFGGDT